MLKSVQFYLLKYWKNWRGDFAAYFGRPIPIKSISFKRALPPDPLTRGSAPGVRWGLRPRPPDIGSCSRARHVLSPRTSNPNSARVCDRWASCDVECKVWFNCYSVRACVICAVGNVTEGYWPAGCNALATNRWNRHVLDGRAHTNTYQGGTAVGAERSCQEISQKWGGTMSREACEHNRCERPSSSSMPLYLARSTYVRCFCMHYLHRIIYQPVLHVTDRTTVNIGSRKPSLEVAPTL